MLYSSVGHAGASGYLAAMALLGVAPEAMRPIALTLNIIVAALATWRFRDARYFDLKAIAALLVGSVPLAYYGGGVKMSAGTYQLLVGCVLFCSAAYLIWRAFSARAWHSEVEHTIPVWASPFIGAIIGVLSGLTGTGGGIFLSPLILLMGWAGPKTTAGIAAPFIMANSVAGLAGGIAHGSFNVASVPTMALPLAVAVIVGALLGTWLGIYKMSTRWLVTLLAMAMAIAAVKLIAMSL